MVQKLFSLALVALILNPGGMRLAYAESKEEKEVRYAEKVKTDVLKLGTGESAGTEAMMSNEA